MCVNCVVDNVAAKKAHLNLAGLAIVISVVKEQHSV